MQGRHLAREGLLSVPWNKGLSLGNDRWTRGISGADVPLTRCTALQVLHSSVLNSQRTPGAKLDLRLDYFSRNITVRYHHVRRVIPVDNKTA